MQEVRQSSTAFVVLGPAVDSSGLLLTALTLQSSSVYMIRNAQQAETVPFAGTASNLGQANYKIVLQPAQSGGSKGTVVRIQHKPSGGLVMWKDIQIVDPTYWDNKYGTGLLSVDAKKVNGATPQTAGDIVTEIATDQRLDELISASASAIVAGSVFDLVMKTNAGTFNRETDSLEAIRNNQGAGGGLNTAQVAAAVLDAASADHSGANSVGQRILRLPTAAAGAQNGLPLLDANQRVKAQVEAIDANAINSASIAAEAIDKFGVEPVDGSVTVMQYRALALAVLTGVSQGSGTQFNAPDLSSSRVAFGMDTSRNRTASTLTPP